MCKEDKIQIQISIFSRHDVPVRLCVSFISWCSSEIEMMLLERIVVTKPNFIKKPLTLQSWGFKSSFVQVHRRITVGEIGRCIPDDADYEDFDLLLSVQ